MLVNCSQAMRTRNVNLDYEKQRVNLNYENNVGSHL